jgi:hypothetical protein
MSALSVVSSLFEGRHRDWTTATLQFDDSARALGVQPFRTAPATPGGRSDGESAVGATVPPPADANFAVAHTEPTERKESTVENHQDTGMVATIDRLEQPSVGEIVHDERRGGRKGWITTILVAVVAAATAILVWQVAAGGPTLDGYDVAELQRMERLATPRPTPSDGSAEAAELERMLQLAPTENDSWIVAEYRRLQRLAAASDGSSEAAELQRMESLAPPIDSSSELAEFERMQRLRP